jgi:hypothetical protein
MGSLTTDRQVVRLLTSPCVGHIPFCEIGTAGRGFECGAYRVSISDMKSKSRCRISRPAGNAYKNSLKGEVSNLY